MKKKIKLLLFFSIVYTTVSAQTLPVKEWGTTTHNNPFIFYISGDGGLNKFSNELCSSINQRGFEVAALDAKSYFWDKKTPEQTASDVSNFLLRKINYRKDQKIVLIGYSFGADVLPFILERLPETIQNKLILSILMASSGSTDMEIHLSDMFGSGKKRSMDVLTELNKLNHEKILILNSSDEHGLDAKKITLKNYSLKTLPGGHHFDGDIDEITKTILQFIYKEIQPG